MKLLRLLSFSAVPFAFSASALGQTSQEHALSSRLFDDASALMTAGKAAEACPKFAESQRLDPQLGTQLHLAECYAKVGKKRERLGANFKDAAEIAASRKDPREAKIRERVSKLEKTLSNLTIAVAAPVAGEEIRQDGALVGQAVWGSAAPVDPGEHTLTATAPGMKPWSSKVQVAAAAAARVDVPALEAEAAAAPAPAPAVVTEPAPSPPPPAPPTGFLTPKVRTIAGWSAIGLGAVGVGVGIGFTLQRSSLLDKRDGVCNDGVCPDATLERDQKRINGYTSDARTAGTIATVGYIAGGVFAAGGVVLLLTARKSESADTGFAPIIAPGVAGLLWSGKL